MSKVSFIAEEKKTQKSGKGSRTILLFLIVGVCGILQFFQAMRGISYVGWKVYPAAAAVCTALWYVWFYRRKWFPWTVVFGLVLFGAAVFGMREIVQIQLLRITECIVGTAVVDSTSLPVTETMVLLTFPISLFLVCLELLLKNHAVLYMLTTGLLLFTPLYSVWVSNGTTLLMLFFQITFWAMQWSGGSGSAPLEKKSVKITAAFLLLCIVAGYVLAWRYPQELFTMAAVMEKYVYQTADHLSGRAGEPITGGRISGGNNYYTGVSHLELTISGQPTESLYLRGFCGGEYIGGDWIRSNDEEVFANMEENLGWQEWSYMISGMYRSMYYMMNRYTQYGEGAEPFTLTIRHLNGKYENSYVPYYSRRNSGWPLYYEVDSGYSYSFFEQKDMKIRWNQVLPDTEQMSAWYGELQKAYMDEIQTVYTRVPEELVPRLTTLAAKYPLEDLNEISVFILYLLHNNAVYTLTPGWAPFNRDIAEYFLFESGRGYCQHFALTATLLYRLYGVPARYATGYRIEPSDFELQEDGSWLAVATDEAAHAWVEIFLEDYGWTPVEVTPAADGSTVAKYPGFDGPVFNRILSQWRWNAGASGSADAADDSEESSDTADGEPFEFRFALWENEKLRWIFGTCLLYSLFLSPALIDYNRLRRLKKVEVMNCREVYARLMEMLHFGGCLSGCDGSERDFAKRLSMELPQIRTEDISRMWDIVCEAAYGTEAPSADREDFVRNVYRQTAEAVYGTLKWYRKLLFRYWKAYG